MILNICRKIFYSRLGKRAGQSNVWALNQEPRMNRIETLSLDNYLDRLFGRINYERQSTPQAGDFKLANMLEFVRRLGDPHLSCPVVHVAGTKGKGSVSTFIGAMLTASGRKTGVYTSPHLETVHERIAIDGQIIEDGQLLELFNQMEPVIREMDDRSIDLDCPKLTFFEIITAAAMLHFSNQKVDVVILEVGMGGRLDSTNVCQPELCVITNISLDHTQQLGPTVDRIAREKSGIIKLGVPVVSGAVHPEVVPVIETTARRCSAELFTMGHDFHSVSHNSEECGSVANIEGKVPSVSNRFDARGSVGGLDYEINDLELGVLGGHQQLNASLSIAAIHVLKGRGWELDEQAIRNGLSEARLEGRTEVLLQCPRVVVDMAHNVASATALADVLQSEMPEFGAARHRRLLFAASREKDVEGMLRPLAAVFDEICLTQFTSNPRGMPVDELVRIADRLQPLTETRWVSMPDAHRAWQWCHDNMEDADFTCITGSVFLVAELRPMILQILNDC